MKNLITIAVIITVVVIVAFGAYKLFQVSSKSDPTMQKTTQESMDKKEGEEMVVISRYIEYSKVAIENAATNRRVLFFYASWCPTCKPADESFTQSASKIPNDVTLIRINYNDPETDQEEKDLAKKYGITYQHTFVQIDATGKEVTKWNGGQINELLSNIK